MIFPLLVLMFTILSILYTIINIQIRQIIFKKNKPHKPHNENKVKALICISYLQVNNLRKRM
ncbi:hypothetical protein CWC18_18715 [Pseudoalteromonas aurantia]|uniref:Uncharacterized protein n=1 Tax=Pseudoalteromonas aurantia TaxID=43654 RepID=A0A5S3V7F6_9GAMM|nr:hypothetical protein CWC18_18715 [Pseudoalteromonas aurantia]TMO67753.1 hypothetical protein CWC19_12780 [Pseudoalteromonas aurantia]TMO74102.1 hypothetical protein CWC20_11770 [Pseudoalteromonas aurantia]